MTQSLTALAISNSQSTTNKSPGKQQYSFPKSVRFRESYKSNCEAIYDLPKRKGNGIGIGYGNRYDFTKQSKEQRIVPGPNQYNLESSFEQMRKHNQGFSIAIGREKLPQCELINKNGVPGPGSYNTKYDKYSSAQYSMASKYNKKDKNEQITPGPAAYSPQSAIQQAGRYIVGKYENVKGTVIAQPVSKKMELLQKINQPGPCSYSPSDFKRMDGKLIFHEAKFRSYQGVTFGTSRPNSLPKSFVLVPGPGSYSVPSEFGIPLEQLPTYKKHSSRLQSVQLLNENQKQ